ncbi:MAG: porin [Alphaproteobacteria bacterium]|nr:porin [Alphaproteobacteria bacterium]
MRKLLYCSTALVAVAAWAGTAAAADPISLGVSGYWVQNWNYQDADDGPDEPAEGRRDHAFKHWGVVTLGGKTALDNGLEVGLNFEEMVTQLPDESGGRNFDTYGFFEFGGFRVEAGARQGAQASMHYQSPTPSNFGWGLESPIFTMVDGGSNATGGYSTTYVGSGNRGPKLTVFTPRFSGFQLGVSYTPENCKQATGCDDLGFAGTIGGEPLENEAADVEQIWGVGANMVQTLNEVNVAVSGGYLRGSQEVEAAARDDLTEWSAGVNLGYMGFTAGAAYKHSNNADPADGDTNNWSLGLRYATGPWAIGIQYINDSTETAANAEDTYEAFEVGGAWDAGAGIQFVAGFQHHSLESDTPFVADGDATIGEGNQGDVDGVFVGSVIFF